MMGISGSIEMPYPLPYTECIPASSFLSKGLLNMRRCALYLFAVLVIGVLISWSLPCSASSKDVKVHELDGMVVLENAAIRIEYNLLKGVYSIQDKIDKASTIAGIHFECNDLRTDDPFMKRTWKSVSVSDDLGEGKMLTLTCSATGKMTLIQEIKLYRDAGFVVLVGGIENTTGNEVRVKDIRYLVDGQAFGALNGKSDIRMLSGESGVGDTRVTQAPEMVCANNALLTFTADAKKKSLVVGGLTYHDFVKYVHLSRAVDGTSFAVTAYSSDPVGRLVEPGSRYVPDDSVYVDLTTRNPFEALEKYGLGVRAAQRVAPSIFDFPEVDGRAGSLSVNGERSHLNTTPGLVGEMQGLADTGFINYSPAGVRLVPHIQQPENEAGWWDDAHWSKYGYYVTPYETTPKWTKAVKALGGVPITFMESAAVSQDYATANPGHLLPKSSGQTALCGDYTSEGYRKHMVGVWDALWNGGVKGAVLDSSDAWHETGGFADKYATTASAYRSVFDLAKIGLGSDSYIEEYSPKTPASDMTLGTADCQLASGLSDKSSMDAYARCGLRWYKNRVLYTYDAGPLDLSKSENGNSDKRHRDLTLAYMTCGRIVLGLSAGKMCPDEIHDLERVFPIHTTPQSHRPLDAFTSDGVPKVYDFLAEPGWHQIAFFNTDQGSERRIDVDMSRDTAFGGMGLDAKKGYYVYDFWNDRLVGKVLGSGKLSQLLRPGEVRMMSVHEVVDHPQFISTNRHLMQGYVDLFRTDWSPSRRELTGISKVVGGETYKVIIATNGFKPESCTASSASAKIELTDKTNGLAVLSIDRSINGMAAWSIVFAKE